MSPSHGRVLHCAETIKGGIATYLRELIPLQCDEFGANNVLVVIPESQRKELPVPDGVKVETYPDVGGRASNAVRLAIKSLAVARRERVDVVHVHSTFAGALVRPFLALAYRSARVVYCAHGWAWDRPLSGTARTMVVAVERVMSWLSDVIVCISDHERYTALANGIAPARIVVVRNGVSRRRPVPLGGAPQWPDGRLRVLFVGRLDRQKGVDVLFDALRMLGDRVHAVVAGSSVLSDGTILATPENVTSIGWVSPGDLETLFASAQVLVVPSRWEGFGLIAAEAMRAGLPVLATRVGGLPEVVDDGVTGVMVEPESADALATALMRVSPQRWREMGEAGKARFAEHFTMERVHRELCAVYGFNS
ncbi:glycosyltransferase family 4 protein [Niveibacterium umoris]|uniref:Glycosyltransferase involved in cell wall biosynthesis n=1 Tax=Niveibacterium umoris TaxID=1193620 RepID=A0A840BJ38_9RHOO|nr:glycosyltransferase involved in cell wall biosynthesis [Niveibacterium umoris]